LTDGREYQQVASCKLEKQGLEEGVLSGRRAVGT